jgi:hypothetical protein
MPSRNFAIISESHESSATANGVNGVNGDHSFSADNNPRHAIQAGELNAGTAHPAATGTTYTGLCGPHGLDVAYRVEIDHHDREGHTTGYGLSVPALESVLSTNGTTRH